MTKEECAKILDEEIKRAGFARLVPAALYDAAIAAMLRAIVEVFQEDRASLLADVERLRQAIMDARDYVEHQDICAGRIADWRLGATCTCGGDAILAKINAALSA